MNYNFQHIETSNRLLLEANMYVLFHLGTFLTIVCVCAHAFLCVCGRACVCVCE